MKQSHVRFDVEKTVLVETATARAVLMKASVKPQTTRQATNDEASHKRLEAESPTKVPRAHSRMPGRFDCELHRG